MATLFIREYIDAAGVGANRMNLMNIAMESDAVIDQATLSVGAEVKSAAFNANTKFVLITSDAIFSYKVGAAPLATTSMVRFPAGTILFFGVKGGDKLSVIANT